MKLGFIFNRYMAIVIGQPRKFSFKNPFGCPSVSMYDFGFKYNKLNKQSTEYYLLSFKISNLMLMLKILRMTKHKYRMFCSNRRRLSSSLYWCSS